MSLFPTHKQLATLFPDVEKSVAKERYHHNLLFISTCGCAILALLGGVLLLFTVNSTPYKMLACRQWRVAIGIPSGLLALGALYALWSYHNFSPPEEHASLLYRENLGMRLQRTERFICVNEKESCVTTYFPGNFVVSTVYEGLTAKQLHTKAEETRRSVITEYWPVTFDEIASRK